MMVDNRTDYEKKRNHMEHFVKPFIKRLLQKIDFEPDEEKRILNAAESVMSFQSEDEIRRARRAGSLKK